MPVDRREHELPLVGNAGVVEVGRNPLAVIEVVPDLEDITSGWNTTPAAFGLRVCRIGRIAPAPPGDSGAGA